MFEITYALGMCLLAIQPAAGELEAGTATATRPEPAAAELTAGQQLPGFESLDQGGNVWKSADHVGRSIVVLYFYPGDFTGGCIRQAEAFRAGLAKLEEAGIEVVGISGDDADTHRLFHEAYGLQHTLLADPEGKVAKLLGVPAKKGAKVRTRGPSGQPLMDPSGKSIVVTRNTTFPRWTYVLDREGRIISKRMNVDPQKDANEVLEIVANLVRE